jgi:hypothetical protein
VGMPRTGRLPVSLFISPPVQNCTDAYPEGAITFMEVHRPETVMTGTHPVSATRLQPSLMFVSFGGVVVCRPSFASTTPPFFSPRPKSKPNFVAFTLEATRYRRSFRAFKNDILFTMRTTEENEPSSADQLHFAPSVPQRNWVSSRLGDPASHISVRSFADPTQIFASVTGGSPRIELHSTVRLVPRSTSRLRIDSACRGGPDVKRRNGGRMCFTAYRKGV